MDWLLQFMEAYGYYAMFITMVLENANIPIPSEVVLGFSGFLISEGVFQFWPTVLIGTAAGICGSILSYWMGAYGGRPFLLKYGHYFFFSERKFKMAEDLFNKYGGIAIFTGRLLPGVRTFISFPAGVARYPMGKFIFYTIIGTVPWTFFLVWLGSLLGSHWQNLIQYNHEFLMIVIAIAAIGIAVLWWKKKGRSEHV